MIGAHLTDILLLLAAISAGMINSVAGGGTLITFPALLWAGIGPVAANATSTLALVPGSASSAWGYRDEIGRPDKLMLWMALPSLVGGILGAWLVLKAGDKLFSHLVPFLILGATLLFMLQEPFSRRFQADGPPKNNIAVMAGFQFLVATYGGFFGAGIGILMLAALGFAGLNNIHRMNGLKSFAAICINGVAACVFALSKNVHWPIATLMAIGAILGGSLGARLAMKLEQNTVRRVVIFIGFAIATQMFASEIMKRTGHG